MKKLRLPVLVLAFSLVLASAGLTGVASLAQPEPPAPPVRLKTGAVVLDRSARGPQALASAQRGGESGLYLVQWRGPVLAVDKQALAQFGAELGDYLPENAFLVRMEATTAQRIQALPRVRAVAPYRPAQKIDPALKKGNGKVRVRAYTFTDSARATWSAVAAQGGQVLDIGHRFVEVTVPADKLSGLAASPEVVYVEPVRANRLFNDEAATLIGSRSTWESGLDGSGQIVGVADTGLDTGDPQRIHQDFRGRVQALHALGRSNDASDTHGHGTHVAGSIVGTGAASNSKVKGMAPAAKLVFQSVGDAQGGLGGIPQDIGRLFDQAYQAGARIHSNSWGVPATQGGATYDTQARAVDDFSWRHRDMLVLFAAGNDGDHDRDGQPNYGTVSSPGTAKNALTVGASENRRPDRGKHADNPDEVALFSSRGPTGDGRVKPDVVAPGSWILSTRSSLAQASEYWAVQDDAYAYMGGTSMSTPITAGAIAQVRQFFTDRLKVQPAAALIKAAAIAGAVPIQGKSADYGWGRLDLKGTLAARDFAFENEGTALGTGEIKAFTYRVTAGGAPLKVALVWTDYPASTAAAKALVNDLDLEVTGPDGQVVLGNAQLGAKGADRVNNVETVIVPKPAPGTYSVRVRAHDVPQGPQSFAVAVTGARAGDGQTPPPEQPKPEPPKPEPPADQVPPAVRLTAPGAGATLSGQVQLTATASDDGSGVDRVEFLVNGQTVGTATKAPYAVQWDTRQVADGSHEVAARAHDQAGNETVTPPVRVEVRNQAAPPTDDLTESFSGATTGDWDPQRVHIDAASGAVKGTVEWRGQGQLGITVTGPDGRTVHTATMPDGGGRSLTRKLEFAASAPGTYTLTLKPQDGWGQYALRLRHPRLPGTAESVRKGELGPYRDRIQPYAVTMARAGALNVNLSWGGAADLDLYLVDEQGRLLATSTNPRGQAEGLSARLAAGRYLLYVVADTGSARYELRAAYPRSH